MWKENKRTGDGRKISYWSILEHENFFLTYLLKYDIKHIQKIVIRRARHVKKKKAHRDDLVVERANEKKEGSLRRWLHKTAPDFSGAVLCIKVKGVHMRNTMRFIFLSNLSNRKEEYSFIYRKWDDTSPCRLRTRLRASSRPSMNSIFCSSKT